MAVCTADPREVIIKEESNVGIGVAPGLLVQTELGHGSFTSLIVEVVSEMRFWSACNDDLEADAGSGMDLAEDMLQRCDDLDLVVDPVTFIQTVYQDDEWGAIGKPFGRWLRVWMGGQ